MRDTRVYLFTTTVAAAAALVLLLSLLGLGADFGANVWPHAGAGGPDGTRLVLPDAPRPAGRTVFAAPREIAVPVATRVVVAPREPLLTPVVRRRGGVLGDRGRGRPRREAAAPRRPTRAAPSPAPAAAAPAPAPVPIVQLAQPAQQAASTANDFDGADERDSKRGRKHDLTRGLTRGRKRAVAPAPLPAPPAADREEAHEGIGDHEDEDFGDRPGWGKPKGERRGRGLFGHGRGRGHARH